MKKQRTMEQYRKVNAKQKERYLSLGLCYHCGKRPYVVGPRGGKICDECRKKPDGRTPEERKAYEIWLGEQYRTRCFEMFGHACVRCGVDDPDVLELHHRDGRMEDEKRIGGRSYYKQLAESGRTDLVTMCANCHKKEHREAWREETKHLPVYVPKRTIRRKGSPTLTASQRATRGRRRAGTEDSRSPSP